MVRSVKALDGGADMDSTMRSLGDTVCGFRAGAGAGSLMDSKWVPKSRDPSKRPSLESGAEVKSLWLKSNMWSVGTSERVTVSSDSDPEEPAGEEVPSKLWGRGVEDMFC